MRARVLIVACLQSLAVLFSLTISISGVRADEPLRWKFEVGEKLNYNMVQDMNVGMGDQIMAKMHQEMDMIWDVQGVDQATGEAVINQKFDRLRMQVTSPQGNLDFDSKSDKPATGLEALIAPLYKAITQSEFELTMTSRGEIKDAKIPADVLTALKSSPGAAALGEYATEEGFKKMISKSAFVLPKDVPKKGDVTKTSVTMDNQAGDKQIVETSYTYDGTKDIDGTSFAVFKPQLTMSYADKDRTGKPSIAEQNSDGEVLFNVPKGRLKSMKLEQHVTINSGSPTQPAQQKLEQKIEVEVSPRVEKKDGEEKSAEASEQKSEK
jgi:hypothetical protein